MIAATQGLPGAVPLSRVKAVIVKTATIGEVFKLQDDIHYQNLSTMRQVKRNTIGSVYYVNLVHEALEDVSLVPSRFLIDERGPVKI
jgi:ubiquinone biosynthesis protein Coq4